MSKSNQQNSIVARFKQYFIVHGMNYHEKVFDIFSIGVIVLCLVWVFGT